MSPASRIVRIGIAGAAAMMPLMLLMVVVHPFGRPCDDLGPGEACTMDVKIEQQLALDVRGLLIGYVLVFGWALLQARRTPGVEHLALALAATAGLLAVAASAPMAVSSLGSSGRSDPNPWWALIWLAAPPLLVAVRRVTGRVWPALLALLPAAVVLVGGLLLFGAGH